MARILPYSSDVSPDAGIPSRRALPQDAGNAGLSDLGEGLQKTGDTLYDVAQTQETADVYSALAAKRSQWTNELHNRAATTPAGDPNFADNFTRDFGDDIGQMGNNVATRGARLALQRGQAELTSELVQKASVFQIQSAGIKAKVDYQSVINNNRNTVFGDPSQFGSVLRDTSAMLNDPSGPYAKIPADVRAELDLTTKESLALSAVQGTARQDPDLALDQLRSGKWDQFLTGDKRNTAETFAIRAQNAKRIEEDRVDNAQKRADEADWDNTGKQFLKQLNSVDPQTPALSANDIMYGAGKDMPARLQEHWLGMLDRAQKPDPLSQISAANSTHLFKMMTLPDGDPNKLDSKSQIDDAYIGGGLNRTDHDWLVGQFENNAGDGGRLLKTKATFLKSVEPQIIQQLLPGIPKDPNSPEQFYRFSRMVDDKVKEYQETKKNPNDLFNPSKPDYLGGATVQPYTIPLTQQIKDVTSRVAPPAAGPKIGDVKSGYKFKGGDPSLPSSWDKQ